MSIPNLIPHKTLYISGYIYSYYAFVFIFEFPEHISKHILQFHASLFKQITSPKGTGKAYKFSLFMEKEESESYVPPAVEVITVNVEEGYSSSFEVVPWE